MALDVFKEIKNAVLDLQSAQLQTYERPLRKLGQLLKHPDLQPYNTALTAGLDLDAFIKQSEQTGGSMVGSAQLAWPEDQQKALGLTLLLIERLGNDPGYAVHFSHHFFYSGRKIIAGIHSLTGQLIIPFVRDYKNYVQCEGDIQLRYHKEDDTPTGTPVPTIMNNGGTVVYGGQSVTLGNITNLVQQNSDPALAEFLAGLTQIIGETELPPERRAEMLDHVETIAEQGALPPPERKLGRVRAALKQLKEDAEGFDKVNEFVLKYGPMMATFFGLS